METGRPNEVTEALQRHGPLWPADASGYQTAGIWFCSVFHPSLDQASAWKQSRILHFLF
jgi:hypothetical protein